jgi:large subunit ribosomal protein L25
MAIATLSATPRVDTGKGAARSLRRQGQVPGVIYGHARTPQPLAIPTRELEKLLSHISADNTLIELSMDGTSARALIREIQRHPFKRQILHVDFQEVVAGEKVTVRVPIALTGTAVGVRLNGGIVDHIMRELTISVDPASIPNRIEIDITELDLGQSIHVSQVPVPAGATVLDEAEAAVVVIATPRAAIEATAAEGEQASSEPEVIRAKKPEEGAAGDEKGDKK